MQGANVVLPPRSVKQSPRGIPDLREVLRGHLPKRRGFRPRTGRRIRRTSAAGWPLHIAPVTLFSFSSIRVRFSATECGKNERRKRTRAFLGFRLNLEDSSMAIGDTHQELIERFPDPGTGREVVRLTTPDSHCHHCYFYSQPFTPDSRRVVYVSDRTGHRNLFLLDIGSGMSLQLTACRNLVDFHYTLSADGTYLLVIEANQIRRLDLETLRQETLYVQRHPWNRRGIYPGFSDDLSKVLLCQMHADDIVPPGTSGWDSFPVQFRAKPRCRLVLVDLVTGGETVVLEERIWLGHPQARPGDHSTLMYCHEGPWDQVDCRMWLINSDGSGKRPVGYWEPHPGAGAGIRVGHEYFTPDGRFIAFACFPEKHGESGTLRMRAVETLEETNFGPYSNYNHFMSSPDGRWIAGDECRGEGRSRIWLYDVAGRRETPLCNHNSGTKPRVNKDTGGFSTQDAHPHPLFAPDGRTVLFTSDMATGPDGNCSVYMTTIDGAFE